MENESQEKNFNSTFTEKQKVGYGRVAGFRSL
jgi:hypothetical protein